MIVLVTNRRDLTTDYIVRELEARSLSYVRLNTEALGSAEIVLRPDRPQDDLLEIEGQALKLDEVTAAYFRRPEAPQAAEGVGPPATQAYCAAEWAALLKTLVGRFDGLWFNDPSAIVRAEDKPRQLLAAGRLGFRVPATVITNRPDVARPFLAVPGRIAKPLRQALIESPDGGQVMFTTRLDTAGLGSDAGIAAAPVILQQEITKACDLRVTVVGDRLFCVAIGSQAHDETQVDWRRGVRPDLLHESTTLPAEIAKACLDLTRDLGLRFGAIDLVRTPEGEHWFLEINPNGQWAWIE
ncbi:MAG: hypothetical protein ACREE0_21875, partial [Phenylobacterium sp.]